MLIRRVSDQLSRVSTRGVHLLMTFSVLVLSSLSLNAVNPWVSVRAHISNLGEDRGAYTRGGANSKIYRINCFNQKVVTSKWQIHFFSEEIRHDQVICEVRSVDPSGSSYLLVSTSSTSLNLPFLPTNIDEEIFQKIQETYFMFVLVYDPSSFVFLACQCDVS